MIGPILLLAGLGGAPQPTPGADAWFQDFRTYEEVDAYLDDLAARDPDTSILDVGTSIEGRAIRGVRISHAQTRPAILVLGTQHAREWISPMVTACIADRLVRDDGVDPEVTSLLDRLEVIVVPVVNPDGYVYSWDVDRFWRKNRRPGGGVDLNRNWGEMWGTGTQGAGPGSEINPGTAAFSEPETAAIAELVQSRDVVAFLDYHSPVELVLIPFAFTAEPGPQEAVQQAWGESMAATISGVHGRTHTLSKPGIGNPSGGLAQDWFAAQVDSLAFTVELRGGPGNGFILPAAEIVPACEENWAGFMDLAARVSEEHGVDDGASTDGGDETGAGDDGGDDDDDEAEDEAGDDDDGAADDDGDEGPDDGGAGDDEDDDATMGAGDGGTPPYAEPLDTGDGQSCACRTSPPARWTFAWWLVLVVFARRRR